MRQESLKGVREYAKEVRARRFPDEELHTYSIPQEELEEFARYLEEESLAGTDTPWDRQALKPCCGHPIDAGIRQLAESDPAKSAHDDVERIVHAGVDTGVAHGRRQHIQRRSDPRELPACARREGEGSCSVARGKRAGRGHSDAESVGGERPAAIGSLPSHERLEGQVDDRRGDADREHAPRPRARTLPPAHQREREGDPVESRE